MNYSTYQYLFPPRAEVKTLPDDLHKYDTGEYIGQPKFNGSCTMVFTNGTELKVFNRHREPLSRFSPDIEFKKLSTTGKWFVYAGEYLNKGKLGENGQKEQDKFVIWDVLVYDGNYLVGTTLEMRLSMLNSIYPCEQARVSATGQLEIYAHLCGTNLRGIYKAPSYLGDFQTLYTDLVKTDLYEGLVLKKKKSVLKMGFQSTNNQEWQIKCRKETKNYKF